MMDGGAGRRDLQGDAPGSGSGARAASGGPATNTNAYYESTVIVYDTTLLCRAVGRAQAEQVLVQSGGPATVTTYFYYNYNFRLQLH